MRRFLPVLIGLTACILATGCTGSRGPEVVHVPAGQYQEAFSTAVTLVRARGWEPELMDRRSGVIETAPVQAGSLLEPWHLNTDDMGTMIAYTVSRNRTRARLEFRPTGTPMLAKSEPSEIGKADYLGLTPTIDLITDEQPLDLRAWVYTERGATPNQQISHWTGRRIARPRRVTDDPTWEKPPHGPMWIPSDRDRNAERKLLGAIEAAIQTAQTSATAPSAP